ncbi:MAG: hypothetical protein CR217_03950 [Beijerinckiaceae bacterium]|nr:MAG: hypothetical protein CR217_03950 [Beijerinckiaceae bacterium]
MALVLAVTTLMMGLVSIAHAQEECPYGQYRAASGDCVPRPNKNRAGATAICKGGSFSHSEHPHSGGTCSSHGGVLQYLDQ